MQNHLEKELEKIYIIQPITRENADKYRILQEEAVSLIESAGAAYAGTLYQNIHEINAATFIGSGKLAESKDLLQDLDEITILFNGDLSPSQTLNISAALDNRKVIDRTTLILDIFAKNAKSSEGKLQVELAQLKYLYPRLKGKGAALSRLGGGVGTRGPGETQLETDRRYIRGRIKYLENRLKETEKHRALQTARRKKDEVKTIALVGYTNTGKSTLLNALTGAETYVKNELFATLDPTARQFLVEGVPFLLVDTVGFLQDLPHNLIEAFKSTLESAVHCDLALIVCDATGEYDMQIQTTLQTLKEMQFQSPYMLVMNKSENLRDLSVLPYGSVAISAKERLGLDALKR
jgi:GTP-binding protein HflX